MSFFSSLLKKRNLNHHDLMPLWKSNLNNEEVNDLINARGTFSGGQGGLGTAGILAGGQATSAPNYLGSNCTEFWNDNSTTGSFGRIDATTFVGDFSEAYCNQK